MCNDFHSGDAASLDPSYQFVTACNYVAPTTATPSPTFTNCVQVTAPPPLFEEGAGIYISGNTLYMAHVGYNGPNSQVLSTCPVSGTSIDTANCVWQANPAHGPSPGAIDEPDDLTVYGDYLIIPG